jgi:RimJ/RimL family protein N-acetyltransferase
MSEAWMAGLGDPSPWTLPQPLPPPLAFDGIVVRRHQKGDGPLVFEAVDDQREKLLPWMLWVTTDHLSVDDSIHYVEKKRRDSEKPDCLDFPLGIFDAHSGRMLGGTGYHRIRPQYREAEIGYWIRGSEQGRGICTKVVAALLGWGFRSQAEQGWGFRRIVIFTAADNVGSRRVCEKLGMRLELHVKRERYHGPIGYYDSVGFGVLADEWDFAQNRAKPGIGWNDGALGG